LQFLSEVLHLSSAAQAGEPGRHFPFSAEAVLLSSQQGAASAQHGAVGAQHVSFLISFFCSWALAFTVKANINTKAVIIFFIFLFI
jgi:hypothetical protein